MVDRMPTLDFTTCDVFTQRPFSGNPLAIVEGADDLTTAQMQTIAREFNLSETIFVQTPDDPANTAKVRIFFPTAEISFAGHPTIGCALHLAQKRGLDDVVLEEAAGLVAVKISNATAQFTAPVVPFNSNIAVDFGLVTSALGLTPEDIGPHTAGVHEGGPRFLYIPVATETALQQARALQPAWDQLMQACRVDSAYLYTPGFNARMFSPSAGIPEDPATGSASAILASQLLQNDALENDRTTKLQLTQGVSMGRPSEIHLEADVTNHVLTAVRIAGNAVPISQGQITAPSA
jgi:trans-2,3-dihydro-3-hydroxyanthranilate isomerase